MANIRKFLRFNFLFFLFAFFIMNLSAKAAGPSLAPGINLEAPYSNQNITKITQFGGWSVNASGVQKVSLFLDNSTTPIATINNADFVSRPDVYNIVDKNGTVGYPGAANSGYVYDFDPTNVAPGQHIITAKSVGYDNSSVSISKTFKIVKPLPGINLEAPYSNQNITKITQFGGWSVNASGVQKVSLFLDNSTTPLTTINNSDFTKRDDVYAIVDKNGTVGYTGSQYSGYVYNFDPTNISCGQHTVTAISYGNDGSSTSITKTFVKPLPGISLDAPYSNQNITKITRFGGWSVNVSGVQKVSLFLDNSTTPIATINNADFVSRPDVYNIVDKNGTVGYPGAANSGYVYDFDPTNVAPGQHIITAKSVGYDNSSVSISKTFKIVKPMPCMNLESPYNNQIITGPTPFGGWSANASGVQRVSLFLDNSTTPFGTINNSDFSARGDIYSTVDNYGTVGYIGSENPGYSYIFDPNNISPGQHTVTAISYGYDNTSTSISKTINIVKPPALMNIESPVSGYLSDAFTVGGWVLNPSGINRITATIDGQAVGTVTYSKRTDVEGKYPQYTATNPTSGFLISINPDLSRYNYGNHTLVVTATGNDGTYNISTYNLIKMAPAINLESPVVNSTVFGTLWLGGWSVNASGVKRVDFYFDNSSTAFTSIDASHLTSRSDVYSIVDNKGRGGYKGADKAGFSTAYDISSMTGQHTIKAVSVGYDNTSTSFSKKINIVSPMPLINVEDRNNGYLTDNVTLGGWSLNPSGVNHFTVTIDGNPCSLNSYSVSARNDVSLAYPTYTTNNPQSGFTINLHPNINNYSVGNHTVVVTSVGSDGLGVSSTFTLVKAAPITTIEGIGAMQSYPFNAVINVGGWAVNATGLYAVYVNVDGKLATWTTTYAERGDVYAVVNDNGAGGYKNAINSGYCVSLNLSSYQVGTTHTITVIAVGNDGTQASFSIPIYISQTTYTHFNINLATMAFDNSISASGIDPTKIINSSLSSIYQFMSLHWVDGVTLNAMNTMLAGRGNLDGKGVQFLEAAQYYDINPVYFAIHSRIESGNGGLAKSANLARGIYIAAGTYHPSKQLKDGSVVSNLNITYTITKAAVYYNLFGIHAYDYDVDYNGSIYAAYMGWDTVDKAIGGAAQWIHQNYIGGYEDHIGGYDQNTLYEMKWDPYGWSDLGQLWGYEYATAPDWASGIANLMYSYRNLFANVQFKYYIPTYNP